MILEEYHGRLKPFKKKSDEGNVQYTFSEREMEDFLEDVELHFLGAMPLDETRFHNFTD